MNATEVTLKAGDVVIYCDRYGADPKLVNVDKVTKKGWITVAVPRADGTTHVTGHYKLNYRDEFRPVSGRHDGSKVFLNTPERWAELKADAEKAEQYRAAKRAEQERHEVERAARHAAELTEAKEACGGLLSRVLQYRAVLEDGSRLHVFSVPVKPDLVERKGARTTVIARLKDEKDHDWSAEGMFEVTRVGLYLTYADQSTSSFPSCSGERFATDEEALWEAIRHCYHSW